MDSNEELPQDNCRISDLGLSPREQEIATLIARGVSNKEIAHELGLAFATVKGYVADILHKLNARSRSEVAAKWASVNMRGPDGAELPGANPTTEHMVD